MAGTDTGVGKTVVTGLLARNLSLRGYRVATQKWVQTGRASDLDAHLRWMGRSRAEFRGFLRAMVPGRAGGAGLAAPRRGTGRRADSPRAGSAAASCACRGISIS